MSLRDNQVASDDSDLVVGRPTGEMELCDKFVYNPYTNRIVRKEHKRVKSSHYKEKMARDISAKNVLSASDKRWHGTRLTQKTKSFRLFLQNPNGVDISDNVLFFRLMMDDLNRHKIDMLLLPESNLNTRCAFIMEKLRDSSEAHCDSGRFFAVNTPNFPMPRALHQPGGVASVLRGKHMTRFAGIEYDHAGRWIAHKFFGKRGFLKIYSLYRVCKNGNKTGDTTAWAQQSTYLSKKNGKDINPRKRVVDDLRRSIEEDLCNKCEIVVAGDFNEGIGEELNGIHGQLVKIGLVNVFHEKIGQNIPRTYKNGSKCLDFIYTTMKVYESITACGIAPFDYFQKSDHRGQYIDIDLTSILDTENIKIHPASFRRLKMNSISSIQKYEDQIGEELNRHNLQEKLKKLRKMFKTEGVTKATKKALNKLDSEITASLLNAEKKCSKISMQCRLDWSPQLKFVLRNYRWAKNYVKRVKNEGLVGTVDDYNLQLKKAYSERRKWKSELSKATKNASSLREQFLDERAIYLSEKKSTEACDELKMLKHHEKQRKEAGRVKTAVKGRNYASLNVLEIPAKNQYTINEMSEEGFSHKNIDTIWKKIHSSNNGKLIKEWEKIETKAEVERLLVQWMELYQRQAFETPFASKTWEAKLSGDEFRSRVLAGDVNPDEFEEPEMLEFLQALEKQNKVREVEFTYTFDEFLNMIRKMKEKTSSSPSGRHIGHYKVLSEMEDRSMLELVYGVLELSMSYCVVLDRFFKVATTLLEKDPGQPRIHRLRPICIVETELNCVAKSQWSKKLMGHVEKFGLLTEDQYGGRKHCQAQSAVINKVLYYNIQSQTHEDAIFIDKDGRSCFDRLIPNIVSLENEKCGASKQANKYMQDTLDNQEIHYKSGYGITKGFVKKSENNPKFGAGQGIGWSGQACNATLNIISNAMANNCKGMVFLSPSKAIRVSTFGDYFVDDTELGTNEKGKEPSISLIEQARFNDQKHSLYWFVSGGRNAVEKGSWYYLKHKFVKGIAIPCTAEEINEILQTRASFAENKVPVPQLEVDVAHKTLGCWVCPLLNQTKQVDELKKLCVKWVQRVTGSFLKASEKILAYNSVLLKQLEYRLPTTCLTKDDCDEIMSIYYPTICHGYHIHRNFNRKLICASKKYGGLGLTHLYDLMGQWKTKFLVKHLRRNDKTGKLFRVSLEFTQMEVGTKEPFYNLNFYDCKKIITPTWLTHLWQYWTDANIKPEISNMWTYQVERINDVFLMDLLRPGVKDENTLAQLNLCRMQLGVITLSDITSLSGEKILSNIHDGKNMRKSKLLWPKQKVPAPWWTQWSNYITSIVEPYIHCHKLGKRINQGHQYFFILLEK
jgi:hypothetical protein